MMPKAEQINANAFDDFGCELQWVALKEGFDIDKYYGFAAQVPWPSPPCSARSFSGTSRKLSICDVALSTTDPPCPPYPGPDTGRAMVNLVG